MSIQRTLVRQILLWLQGRYEAWKRDPRGPASKFRELVSVTCPEFGQTELEALLSKKIAFNSSGENRYLFLEPLNEGKGIVPVLSFSYDFQGKNAELRLRLALFVPHNNSLAAIGFRFEPSEGPGTHDYFHAQMFREFRGRGGKALPECPTWLPTSQPAFHLKADDPVTLLVCMVISLYGIDVAGELEQQSFANALKPYMRRLCPAAAARNVQQAITEPTGARAKRRPG